MASSRVGREDITMHLAKGTFGTSLFSHFTRSRAVPVIEPIYSASGTHRNREPMERHVLPFSKVDGSARCAGAR
ncbi:hypothetical protein KCV03_g32, partial [Aureobasidium melanogenum]